VNVEGLSCAAEVVPDQIPNQRQSTVIPQSLHGTGPTNLFLIGANLPIRFSGVDSVTLAQHFGQFAAASGNLL
jgi:hypothetical protein